MAATNINRVIITGNLTSDPELRSLPSGTSVCKLRVACNTRRKDNSTGEWVDKPNYFDVTVWGAQGENCARYLPRAAPSRSTVASSGASGRPTRARSARRRHHRRLRAVPRRARRRPRGGNGFTPRSDVPVDTERLPAAPSGRRRTARRRPPTTTSRSRPAAPAGLPAADADHGPPSRGGPFVRKLPQWRSAPPCAARPCAR